MGSRSCGLWMIPRTRQGVHLQAPQLPPASRRPGGRGGVRLGLADLAVLDQDAVLLLVELDDLLLVAELYLAPLVGQFVAEAGDLTSRNSRVCLRPGTATDVEADEPRQAFVMSAHSRGRARRSRDQARLGIGDFQSAEDDSVGGEGSTIGLSRGRGRRSRAPEEPAQGDESRSSRKRLVRAFRGFCTRSRGKVHPLATRSARVRLWRSELGVEVEAHVVGTGIPALSQDVLDGQDPEPGSSMRIVASAR
jgi:hypothetical protein